MSVLLDKYVALIYVCYPFLMGYEISIIYLCDDKLFKSFFILFFYLFSSKLKNKEKYWIIHISSNYLLW